MSSKTVLYTPSLAKEYSRLFDSATLRKSRIKEASAAAKTIVAGREEYEAVATVYHCPWTLIGVIHMMEASCNFKLHIHNGNPLTARTTDEPRGRPETGNPPFKWRDSAIDAFEIKHWDKIETWTLERALFELERYNGFGYRLYHPTTLSPYLWSATDKYSAGKYVKDGVWSATAVSGQVGAVALLLALQDLDPELSLAKMLPREAENGSKEDTATVKFVQGRLRELGYTMVGRIDGIAGRDTEGAILMFRHENGLASSPEIDDDLLTALARATPRGISAERALSTAADLRKAPDVTVPGLAGNFQTKILSSATGIGAVVLGMVQGVLGKVTDAKSMLDPIKDMLSDVPPMVWFGLVGVAAFLIWRNASHSESEVVSAYNDGTIR